MVPAMAELQCTATRSSVISDGGARAIDLLADNPRPPKAIQLVGGADEWRVRTGDYRIIYEIDDDTIVVLVLRVGHRGDVYETR